MAMVPTIFQTRSFAKDYDDVRSRGTENAVAILCEWYAKCGGLRAY